MTRIVSHTPERGASPRRTHSSDRDSCSYRHCETELARDSPHRFCQRACAYREHARSLLGDLFHDHRYCANCWTYLRDIEPPKPEWAWGHNSVWDQEITQEAAVGYAHATAATQVAIRSKNAPAIPDGSTYRRTSFGCQCGTTDPRTVDRPLSFRHLKEFTKRLCAALSDYHADEAFPTQPTQEAGYDPQALLQVTCTLKQDPECDRPDTDLTVIALGASLETAATTDATAEDAVRAVTSEEGPEYPDLSWYVQDDDSSTPSPDSPPPS